MNCWSCKCLQASVLFITFLERCTPLIPNFIRNLLIQVFRSPSSPATSNHDHSHRWENCLRYAKAKAVCCIIVCIACCLVSVSDCFILGQGVKESFLNFIKTSNPYRPAPQAWTKNQRYASGQHVRNQAFALQTKPEAPCVLASPTKSCQASGKFKTWKA